MLPIHVLATIPDEHVMSAVNDMLEQNGFNEYIAIIQRNNMVVKSSKFLPKVPI